MAMHKLVLMMLTSIVLQRVRGQDSVDQKPLLVSKAGENPSITCKYKTSTFYGLHWYRQYPGGRPTFLLQLVLDGSKKEDNFNANLNLQEQLSNLTIKGVQLTDAASYVCALTAQ